jgi:hypothetical protein
MCRLIVGLLARIHHRFRFLLELDAKVQL